MNLAAATAKEKATLANYEAAHDGRTRLHVVNVGEFLAMEFPAREYIMEPFIRKPSATMVHSYRGVGKTYLGSGLGLSVAAGTAFLRWNSPIPRRVLLVDGEMPAPAMKERLSAIAAGNGKTFDPDFFRLITPDLQEFSLPSLSTTEGQHAIEDQLGDTELLILDNLSTLCRGGKENESESALPLQEWILSLRKHSISTVIMHHSGKNGAQRGTSRREDILDTVISLRHPDDYSAKEGCRFEVHFEKSRGVHGDAVAPFEVRMQSDSTGACQWFMRDLEDLQEAKAKTLFEEGCTPKDVMQELKMSRATAYRFQKKWKEGRL